MGIGNLLIMLNSIQEKKHISDYRNKTLAVDGYSWLHKAIYTSGYDIAVQNDNTKLLKFLMQKVSYMMQFNIKLIMVFDGDKLPSKDKTEDKREANRKRKREEAFELLQQGDYEKANRKFAESIDVTPLMAYTTLNGIRESYPDIECIVAPYEADAQLAYLSKIGYVDGVITEDSDLLPFGTHCIITKLDQNFECREIRKENIKKSTDIDFSTFDEVDFLCVCILSGCDYLASQKGVAFKTAHSAFIKHKNIKNTLDYMVKAKKGDDEYIHNFYRAYLTFLYQRVWCPIKNQVVHQNPLPDELETNSNNEWKNMVEDIKNIKLDNFKVFNWQIQKQNDKELIKYFRNFDKNLDFLGPNIDPELGKKIADCKFDPIAKISFEELQNLDHGPTKEKIMNFIEKSGVNNLPDINNNNTLYYLIKLRHKELF